MAKENRRRKCSGRTQMQECSVVRQHRSVVRQHRSVVQQPRSVVERATTTLQSEKDSGKKWRSSVSVQLSEDTVTWQCNWVVQWENPPLRCEKTLAAYSENVNRRGIEEMVALQPQNGGAAWFSRLPRGGNVRQKKGPAVLSRVSGQDSRMNERQKKKLKREFHCSIHSCRM